MKRGIITPDVIEERAIETTQSENVETKSYLELIETIKEEVDNIVRAKRKITLKLITSRLQLKYPNITRAELSENYWREIVAYSSRFDHE